MGYHDLALEARDNEKLSPALFHRITVYLVSKNVSQLFNTKSRIYLPYLDFPTPLDLALKNIEAENRTLSLLSKYGVDFTKPNSILCPAVAGKRSLQLISFLRELGANCLSDNYENTTALHVASSVCYVEELRYFLNVGLKINEATPLSGDTPLHRAVVCEKESVLEAVRFLIARGANVSTRNVHDGLTPLTRVIQWQEFSEFPDMKRVLQVLRDARLAGGNPDKVTPDELGHQIFHAIAQEYEDTLQILIEAGANVNVRNSIRETPLITAGKCGGRQNISSACLRIVKYLIEHGAEANAQDEVGNTFLHYLVTVTAPSLSTSQFHDIACYIVAKNLTNAFNIYGGLSHSPPIMEALSRIDVEIGTLDLLHENGVIVKGVQNIWGESILHRNLEKIGNMTTNYINTQIFFKLVELGVDWKGSNKFNDSLLHAAAENGKVEELVFLIGKGLDVNAQTSEGSTPLHWAVSSHGIEASIKLELVRLLLEHGADVKLKNDKGDTPLSQPLTYENDRRVIQLLEAAG